MRLLQSNTEIQEVVETDLPKVYYSGGITVPTRFLVKRNGRWQRVYRVNWKPDGRLFVVSKGVAYEIHLEQGE